MKFRFNGLGKYYYDLNKVLLFLLVLIILVNIFPRQGKLKSEYQKGKPWQHDELIAPFDFAVKKSDAELQRERRGILNNSYLFFRYDQEVANSQRDKFLSRFDEEWEKKNGADSKLLTEQWRTAGQQTIDTLFARGIIEMTHEI